MLTLILNLKRFVFWDRHDLTYGVSYGSFSFVVIEPDSRTWRWKLRRKLRQLTICPHFLILYQVGGKRLKTILFCFGHLTLHTLDRILFMHLKSNWGTDILPFKLCGKLGEASDSLPGVWVISIAGVTECIFPLLAFFLRAFQWQCIAPSNCTRSIRT